MPKNNLKKENNKIPRLLLVGCGRFGHIHARILKELSLEKKIEFVGIVVRDKKKTNDIVAEFKVDVFEDLSSKILASVDAVIIVTPVESHFDIAKKCLKYTNVFVEKPITDNHKEAFLLDKIAKKYNRVLSVGHIFRFHPVTEYLQKILKNKPSPKSIKGSFINPIETDKGRDPAFEMLHMFDIVDFLYKREPVSVFARWDERIKIVDIRYAKSCDASFSLGWKDTSRKRSISFVYDDFSVEADFVESTVRIIKGDKIDSKQIVSHEEPLKKELCAFIGILAGNRNTIDGALGSRIVSISERAEIAPQIKKPKVAIIGAGIFGSSAALELSKYAEVELFDRGVDFLTGGSFVNQFRHHDGYHYPRSDETVREIQKTKSAFEEVFGKAIISKWPTYYGVSKKDSLVSAQEFKDFCKRNNLPFSVSKMSDEYIATDLMDLIVKVPESNYQHDILKKLVSKKIKSNKHIQTHFNTKVIDCSLEKDGKKLLTYISRNKSTNKKFDFVINATYAHMNQFQNWMGFKYHPVRVDLVEVLIVKIPIEPISFTIIDGPFATLMPTGRKNEFTLYHVTESILSRSVPENGLVPALKKVKTNYEAILRESKKLLPILEKAEIVETRIIHRGVQAYQEHDDARIADLIDHGFGTWSILSGKILSSVSMGRKIADLIKKSI